MQSEPKWLSAGNVSPDMIRGRNIKVKDKTGREISAHLEVENLNAKGEIVVSANYNSSPFQGTVAFATFYLTQEQLDDFLVKGPNCVLGVPR